MIHVILKGRLMNFNEARDEKQYQSSSYHCISYIKVNGALVALSTKYCYFYFSSVNRSLWYSLLSDYIRAVFALLDHPDHGRQTGVKQECKQSLQPESSPVHHHPVDTIKIGLMVGLIILICWVIMMNQCWTESLNFTLSGRYIVTDHRCNIQIHTLVYLVYRACLV